jgi:hypothetical protein
MSLNYTLENNIESMLMRYGLRMDNVNPFAPGPKLPNYNDLGSEEFYNNCNEDTKMKVIKEFVFKENYFRIVDLKLFLPNFKIDKEESFIFENILYAIAISLENESIKFNLYKTIKDKIEKLLNNKEFIKIFSKDFQLRAIFSPKEQLYSDLKIEITNFIGDKLNEMGIIDKINEELPKIIMKDLEKETI